MEKKVLYFSDSRFPLAAVAGAIHTGYLPVKAEPGVDELRRLPLPRAKKKSAGRILYHGRDGRGNKVYALWLKGEKGMPYRLIDSFLDLYRLPKEEFYMVDTPARDNALLVAGQFLRRMPLFSPLGLYLVRLGLKKEYGGLSSLVQKVIGNLTDLP
ncbi:MAG: DUF3189 family protein [Firmicutes bacterium]|nr:DUF3189 family protein [Bacillota bacterium]